MNLRIYIISLVAMLCMSYSLFAQRVDYSVVSVQEESGTEFTKITTVGDYVCMPLVTRSGSSLNWISNRILDISREGTQIAYLSCRNNTVNIFIKDLNRQGGSVQRTNRTAIWDFSYSPDGKYICFSEQRGNENQIFQTSSDNGYVCRQMTSGNQDFSPIYSSDMKLLLFARQERMGVSIWSYNVGNNFLSSYSSGMILVRFRANKLSCVFVPMLPVSLKFGKLIMKKVLKPVL